VLADVVNLLQQVTQAEASLPQSERKVARVVLAHPDTVIHSTLADLARMAGVSEPTVVRFCRSVGCKGFQDFKVRLAQSVATPFPFADFAITPDDSLAACATKIFTATVDTLLKVLNQLDLEATERAVQALAKARKIEFYGFGASGNVALDAHHKFFRLGRPCSVYIDAHLQYMSAATLDPEGVVVAISHTGRTKELLESVRLARGSGATVIAVTARRSPLAAESSIVLPVDVPEDTDLYTPMTSRLAHLMLIDTLAVGLALRSGEGVSERLRRMKESLQHKRVPRTPEREHARRPKSRR
jgi:RpiR family carbohydrate utilization transcriptional regulator